MDNQALTIEELDQVTGGLIHEQLHAGSSGSNPVPPVYPQPYGWPDGKGPKGSRIEGCW